jgi:hypothetical protein
MQNLEKYEEITAGLYILYSKGSKLQANENILLVFRGSSKFINS